MKTSCNIASPDFLAQIHSIEPSISYGGQLHYPCKLRLKDGELIERAICTEDHRGFLTDAWVHPDSVKEIIPSFDRMPARLATKLYSAGESGMGYEIFILEMKDGSDFVFVTNNVVDFPDLPNGYTTTDIQNVHPHKGRERSKLGYRQDKPFKWCYYVKE